MSSSPNDISDICEWHVADCQEADGSSFIISIPFLVET